MRAASRPLLLIGLASVAVAVSPASASRRIAAVPCGPSEGHTLLASNKARIYTLEKIDVGGCWKSSRKQVFLGPLHYGSLKSGEYGGVRLIRLAGHFAAFEKYDSGRGGAHYDIFVTDLKTGRRSGASTVKRPGVLATGVGHAADLVLSRRGSVAWIAADPATKPPLYQVQKLDSQAHLTLDSSTDIDPDSLALSNSGARVYWTKGGVPQSAPLQ